MNVTITEIPFKVEEKTISYISFLNLLLEKSIQESEELTIDDSEKFTSKELKILGKMPGVNRLLGTLKKK